MTERKTLLPGATIGVMGGGQLGRMFASRGAPDGISRPHLFAGEEWPGRAVFRLGHGGELR